MTAALIIITRIIITDRQIIRELLLCRPRPSTPLVLDPSIARDRSYVMTER
jgi:hypothetical protein